MVKKALVVCGNSSSEFEELGKHEDASMLAVKGDDGVFHTLFALMKKFDDEAKEDVTLLDLKKNLNLYSMKKTNETSLCVN